VQLGGKNPVFVTAKCNLRIAAAKIVDAKFANVGQFCVSPDHVLVQRGVDVDAFKAEIAACLRRFYGEDPQQSAAYSRIVNERHWARCQAMVGAAHGGETVTQPPRSEPEAVAALADEADLYVPPCVVFDPAPSSALLTEEIFGPALAVLTERSEMVRSEYNGFGTLADMVRFTRQVGCTTGAPLALYILCDTETSEGRAERDYIISHTRSGGVCVNDFQLQMLNENLPFGGLGDSGFGNYHGQWGIRAFQHERAVLGLESTEFNERRYPRAPL